MQQIADSARTHVEHTGHKPPAENSMRSLVFEGNTWTTAYEQLRTKDARRLKALCTILKEMLRENPATGTGKPEALRHNLTGFLSRRLS